MLTLTQCISAVSNNIKGINVDIYNKNTNMIEDDSSKSYFVIGIGFRVYGGHWPFYDQIDPIFLLKFGKTSFKILGLNSDECIDFVEGDKLIGHYPHYPFFIGFVCGVWIDI